jgi:hypothetical protein
VYERLGVRCLADAVTKVVGPPIDPKQARRGDIVMKGSALGICRGDLAEFANLMLPMREVEKAWRRG